MLTLQFNGVTEALDSLEHAVGDEMPRGLWQVGQDVAAEAKANHLYQNRTGDLEALTEGSQTAGSFYDDTLIVSVDAGTPYASYVDGMARFAFLLPAWERSDAQTSATMNTALEHAIDRAGWSR